MSEVTFGLEYKPKRQMTIPKEQRRVETLLTLIVLVMESPSLSLIFLQLSTDPPRLPPQPIKLVVSRKLLERKKKRCQHDVCDLAFSEGLIRLIGPRKLGEESNSWSPILVFSKKSHQSAFWVRIGLRIS